MLKDTVPTGFRFGCPLLGFPCVTHILLCETHTLMSQEPGPPTSKATDHSSHPRITDVPLILRHLTDRLISGLRTLPCIQTAMLKSKDSTHRSQVRAVPGESEGLEGEAPVRT